MRFLVIACVLLFSLAAHGQSAVRRIASLTNLVAGIDPAAVDTGSKVSYLVDGYYAAGDWGTAAREFTATKTAGTTNFAHLIRSTKNTNYYWRSSDASDPVQDIRKWGAIMSDGVDDAGNVQAAINFCNGQQTVFFPAGVTRLESALTFPTDYQEFDGAGFNANLQVAHNGNGFQHLGVTNGEPRRYNLVFRNFRMTTAAGYAPQAAFRVDDTSYSTWDFVYVTQGAGDGFDNAWKSFGHYDLGTAVYGGNWGNSILNCQWWNKAGGDYVIRGDGGPSSTGGPNDIRILASYVSGGLSGSPSNGAAGAVFLQNCNAVRVENNDFEQYSTNGVWIGTNVQSAVISNNRFENQGGTTATRRLIHFDDYTTQGHVVSGNMMLIQGGGGSITRISGPGDSKRIPASIIDPSFEGPGQLLASTWLVGTNLDGILRDYGPYGNKLFVMDRDMATTNILGLAVIDGTNNPRAAIVLRDSGDGSGTNSRVDFSAASSRASIPVYFIGAVTNAVITSTGSSILGLPDSGNALTVYGSGMFGSVPENPYIDGWTTSPELIGVRGSGTNKLALFVGTIDGSENRRAQIIEDPVAKTVTFSHGYTTGGGTTLHQVGTKTVFQLTDSLLTVNTNTTFIPGVTITAGNQVPQSRKEWPVDWVNVLDFGAYRNSTNDSTPAFKSAVDSGAAVVYVPNGSYDFRSTLEITNSVRLMGDHRDTTTLRYFGTNSAIRIGGGTNFNKRGISVENFLIIGWEDPPYSGAYAPSNALAMIHVYGGTRGSLKHLRLSNAMTGAGVLFERRAYYWDLDDVNPFDTKYGIWILDQNPGVGDLVDTINIQNSVLSGCDWGAVLGDPTVAAGSGERGVAVINFTDTSIEGNRIGGLWINQSELVSLNNTYFEANGRSTNGQGVHVRLGNSLDTNAWSASGIRLIGTRWADTTNSVEIYSANNVTIKDNDHQGVKGTGVPIVFMTTNHIDVQIDGDFARQYPSLGYNPPVTWMEGIGSSITKYVAGPTNGSLKKQSISAEFGDDSGTWMSIDRVFYANRFLSANSTNGTAGIFASRFGATGQARAGAWTDGSDAYIGGGFEGGAMPIQLIMNGTRYMTLDDVQTANPNRFVVGATNGYTPLTVHGNIMFGSPTNYGGFSQFDKQLSFISRDQAESIGLVMYSYDGTTNRSLVFGIDPAIGDAFLQLGYSSGGEIPFVIRSSFNNDIVSLIDSGLTIRNGAGLTLGSETITDLTGSGITIVGGALTATSTPYTSFWPDLTNSLIAGANVTFAYDTGNETITINSSGGGGGATNGSSVSVNGTYLSELNLQSTVGVLVNASGTNVEWTLADRDFGDITVTDSGETFVIDNGVISTNKIDSTFYAWVDSQSGGGGGGGDVYAASNNVFTGTNTFTGPITGNVFSVSTLILANPIGLTAIGTNLADAQDELQLTPGVYTMAYDLDLLQLATMTWSNGVMAYHNGSTITNLVSTSTGRSLITASSATNGRDVLEVGQLDQSAYSVAWDGVTNATPTLNALYDKIQSLPGGSNNISSWNTNYFSVTGGYLDWIGGSVSGGGGVTWIGNLGLSPLTNAATTTNVLLANFEVTTNKSVTTDGRFLDGGLDLMLTNASSINAAFNLRTKANGTTIADLQRSMATSTAYEFHTMRFRLIRESSTTAHLTLLGERWGGSVPSVGYGTFGSSGGEDLIVATNIAWNWGQSNTLSMEIGMSWSGTPTTNAIGVQRIAANLYNPGDGSSGGSSGTNTVFTVNGVTFDPVIITNSATVTWATNANGHIQATASVSGGGGLGTNIFVNGSLVQPAMLTNGYGLSWSTSGSQIIPVVTNNFGSGYANGFLPLYAGVDNKLTGDLHFLQNSDIRLALMEADQLAEPLYRQWGFRAFGGKFEIGTLATNDITWNETWIEFDPTDDTWGSNIVTFANGGFNNRVDFEAPVEFGEAVRFSAGVELGSTNLSTALANKQGLNANLTTVANLTSGTPTNFLAGDGTFKQVTTNMIPGLNAALASAGGGVRMLFSAFAKDFVSGTNASAQALDVVRGDGRRFARFSGSTDNERLFEGVIPPSANLAGGLKITLHFSSTNTVGSNVVWQLQLAPGTGVDPTSTAWNTAVKMTNTLPGSVAITNAALNYADLASITNRQPIIGRVLRDQSSASDTETGNVDLRAVVLEILDTN